MKLTSTFFRDRAAQCGRDADRASLDNVRELSRKSQAAWLALADARDRRDDDAAAATVSSQATARPIDGAPSRK